MTKNIKSKQYGALNIWMVVAIGFIILTLGISYFAYWSYTNYMDQKTDVDSRVSLAVAKGKKEQADSDAAKFADSEKLPYKTFYGPDDYGRASFQYPKTWSMYVTQDASQGGAYEAYLNPDFVPPIASSQLYALRVNINQEDYDSAVTSYNSLVSTGELNSQPITAGGSTGTRFDGKFSTELRGALVIFKIRDKTLTIRTDANTFLPDFNNLVASIQFNQ